LRCDFKFGDDLISFLHAQPHISNLNWTDPDKERGRPEAVLDHNNILALDALPTLEKLVTNSPGFAMTLVPGRPVTTLRVSTKMTEEKLTTIIGSSTGSLRCLELQVSFLKQETRLRFLSHLVHHAPNLRTLGILNLRGLITGDVLQALAALRDLRTLVLWDRVDHEALLNLAAACRSLESVTCLFRGASVPGSQYVRFPVNPLGEPQLMRDHEVPLWIDV